jgi:ABC-type Fe3+-hydroxamate transport system substrate-binding protein
VACRVAEYEELTTPVASEEVVTLNGGAEMAMLRFAEAVWTVGVSESVAVTAKLMGPVTTPVGVPEITPVLAFNDNPDGRAPVVTTHV